MAGWAAPDPAISMIIKAPRKQQKKIPVTASKVFAANICNYLWKNPPFFWWLIYIWGITVLSGQLFPLGNLYIFAPKKSIFDFDPEKVPVLRLLAPFAHLEV
jgi:hypothetical protein